MRTSSMAMGLALSGAVYFGYQAANYDGPPAPEVPVAAENTPSANEPARDTKEMIIDRGKELVRIALLQQTVFGLPERQSDNAVLAVDLLGIAAVIGAVRPVQRRSSHSYYSGSSRSTFRSHHAYDDSFGANFISGWLANNNDYNDRSSGRGDGGYNGGDYNGGGDFGGGSN